MIYILDTHTLVWHLANSPRLSRLASTALLDDAAKFIIPGIVLAEIQFLAIRNRISVSLDEVLRFIDADARCEIYPLDENVARRIPPGLNIHDAAICATALHAAESAGEDVAVLTTDREITASGLVPTVW